MAFIKLYGEQQVVKKIVNTDMIVDVCRNFGNSRLPYTMQLVTGRTEYLSEADAQKIFRAIGCSYDEPDVLTK